MCAFIRWYPYFFVPLDAAWPAGRQSSFVTELVEKHGAVARLSKVVSRKTLWGFTGNEARPFGQLAFPTLAAARRARKRFKTTYEASVDPIIRFFHVRGVPPSGWVCISSFAEVCAGDRQTIADLEIETTYTSVGPAADDGGQIQVPPLVFASWDIECFSGSGKFPMSSNPADKIIQISTTFWRYGEAEPYRTAVVCLLETAAVGGGVDISWFGEEHEVIDAWIELLRAEKADVLLGWNTDQFDWKYVSGRADVLVDDFSGEPLVSLQKLGRLRVPDSDGGEDDSDDDGGGGGDKERGGTSRIFELNSGAYGNNAFHVLTTPGCVQLDLMQYFRKEFKLDSYALNAVSQKYLGESKLDLPAGAIFSKFGGTPADRADIAAYAAQDTLLPLKLLRKMAVFENISEMANAVSVPVSFILTRGQQVRVFSVILQKARAKGFVCPDDVAIAVDGKYAGATVLDAQRGAYFDVVSGLDFASLYPSIMRAYSLCPSTIVLDSRYSALGGVEYYEVDTGLGVYRFAQGVDCVVPSLLEDLAAFRKAAKADMAAAKKAGDDFGASLANGKQLAYKIVMNSCYGFLGASKGFLPCVPIAAAVTATGRAMIEKTKALAESLVPGSRVVYGDTDSVMVIFAVDDPSKRHDLATHFGIAQRVADAITATFPKPVELEFEKVYYPYLLFSKKRYSGERKKIICGYCTTHGHPARDSGDPGFAGFFHRLCGLPPHGQDLRAAVWLRQLRPLRGGGDQAHHAQPPDVAADRGGRGRGRRGDHLPQQVPLLIIPAPAAAGLMYTRPDAPDYIDSKGIQLVRRDNCPLVKDVSQGILDAIMHEKSPDQALTVAREHLLRVLANDCGIDKFIVSKQLRSDYKNDVQPHLTVARKLHARRGYPPNSGERVPYVYVWDPAADPDLKQSERAEDPGWATEHGLALDVLYYIDNQLHNPIIALTELLCEDAETAIFGDEEIASQLAALRLSRETDLREAKRVKKNVKNNQREITSFFSKKP